MHRVPNQLPFGGSIVTGSHVTVTGSMTVTGSGFCYCAIEPMPWIKGPLPFPKTFPACVFDLPVIETKKGGEFGTGYSPSPTGSSVEVPKNPRPCAK